MDIVEITWLDACCEEANVEETYLDAMLPMERKNTGYLYSSRTDYLILVSGEIHNVEKDLRMYDHSLLIPTGMVVKIEHLYKEG